MDIVFLKTPTEATLEVSDLDYVRQVATQRMQSNKRSVSSGNPASVLITNTPGTTPLIQPVMIPTSPNQQVQLRRARRGSRDEEVN
jgi:cystathionine beta-lyase/cystathionine gamma-synthase